MIQSLDTSTDETRLVGLLKHRKQGWCGFRTKLGQKILSKVLIHSFFKQFFFSSATKEMLDQKDNNLNFLSFRQVQIKSGSEVGHCCNDGVTVIIANYDGFGRHVVTLITSLKSVDVIAPVIMCLQRMQNFSGKILKARNFLEKFFQAGFSFCPNVVIGRCVVVVVGSIVVSRRRLVCCDC